MTTISKKGFTLVELLIVIGILAVLATTAVVILNPAQLLAQARDSQRLSDLGSVNSALALYVTDVTTVNLGAGTAGGRCTFDPGAGNGPFATTTCSYTAGSRVVTGTGWVDVNLGAIGTGSPLSVLPTDPSNNATYFYAYRGISASSTWELDAKLESTKYAGGTPNQDLDANDGGNNAAFYEVGTDPSLDL